MNNQNLFEALQNVCGFTALESEMSEIINAYEKDKALNQPPQLEGLRWDEVKKEFKKEWAYGAYKNPDAVVGWFEDYIKTAQRMSLQGAELLNESPPIAEGESPMVNWLKEYLANTPKEQIEKEWKEIEKEWPEGVNAFEYLRFINKPVEQENTTDIRDQVFEIHGVDPNATIVLNPVAKQERVVTDEMIEEKAISLLKDCPKMNGQMNDVLIEYVDVIEAMKAYAEKFGEWVHENRWQSCYPDEGWRRTFSHKEPEHKTTAQLIEMFEQDKTNPKHKQK